MADVVWGVGVEIVDGIADGVVLPVVQGVAEGVCGGEEAALREASATGDDKAAIVAVGCVIGVVDGAEAGVETGLDAGAGLGGGVAIDVLDEIAGEGVDVVAVGGGTGISTAGDEVVGDGTDVADAGDEAVGDLAVDGEVEVDGVSGLEAAVYAADADLRADDATFGVKRCADKGRVGVAEGIRVLGAIAEDGLGGGAVVEEGGTDEAGRVAAEAVFRVSEGEVVVVKTDAGVDEGLVVVAECVSKAAAGAEDVVEILGEGVALGGHCAGGDLCGEVGAGAEVEVGEAGASEGWVGVAEVVVTEAEVDGELLAGLPGVFHEGTGGGLGVAVVVGLGLAGDGIVGEAAFCVGVVVDEVDEAVELEGGLGEGGGEEGDVIAVPSFIASLDDVTALDVGEDVAPVVAVLDVVAEGEAGAEAYAEAGDIDDRNGEGAAGGGETFNAVVTDEGFIEGVGGEGVGLTALDREDVVVVGGGEAGTDRGAATADGAAVELAVGTIFIKVLVEADVVLLGVVVAAGVEDALIEDRGGAGDVVGGGCAATSVGGYVLCAKGLGGGLEDVRKGKGGGVLGEEGELRAVGLGGLRKLGEGWVFIGLEACAVGGESAVGLVTNEEEELVFFEDGAADAKGEIVDVVGGDGGGWRGAEFTARIEALVGVILAGEAMEGVRAGLGGHDGLDGAGTAVVDGVGVGLDAGFLDGVCVGGEVDDAGTDAAGDIETVYDVEVAVGAAAVGASVNAVFRIEVGGGGDAEASDAGGKGEEGERVAGGEGEVLEGAGIECELVAVV